MVVAATVKLVNAPISDNVSAAERFLITPLSSTKKFSPEPSPLDILLIVNPLLFIVASAASLPPLNVISPPSACKSISVAESYVKAPPSVCISFAVIGLYTCIPPSSIINFKSLTAFVPST